MSKKPKLILDSYSTAIEHDYYMFNQTRRFLRDHGILHTSEMKARYIVVNHGQLATAFIIYFEDFDYVRIKPIPLHVIGKEFLFIATTPEWIFRRMLDFKLIHYKTLVGIFNMEYAKKCEV